MQGLSILPLGVGDAFSARYYSSNLLLHTDGGWLLIDCAHPIRKILREGCEAAQLAFDVAQLDAVVLTHLHADHASGLEGLAYYCRYRLGKRLRLVAHPLVMEKLWPEKLAPSMEWSYHALGQPPALRQLNDFFDIIPLQEKQPLQVGPFRLECRRTIHSIPTMALRVQAAGRTLGYSADTAFDASLIEWLNAADMFVHEASSGPMHTPYEKLAALPGEVRKKMRLIHYPDDFDPSASVIEALRQGRLYTI